MQRTNTTKQQKSEKSQKSEARQVEAFQLRTDSEPTREAQSEVHVLGPGIICDTEPRGHATPGGRSPLEIVVDASEGFVPLWATNTTLRWRFRERSMNAFANPAAAKREIRRLFAEALVAWGTAAPVRFTEDPDLWDFEIVMRRADDCNASGCVLASAFFPDGGRHQFVLYPKMFSQSRKEQVETFIHELGHVFGLRHFFANLSETAWPSEIFGTHSKFSIMNYGTLSELTSEDRDDLRRLYQLARSGALTHVNGTPIRLVKPFSSLAPSPDSMVAVGQIQTVVQPQAGVAYIGGI
jgi:hypothetical protein